MNVTVGLVGSAREITLELPIDEDALASRLTEAVNQNTVLELTDTKGQRTLIPGRAVAYIQVTDQQERRVGFAI
ncbi:DUF3107 domain-containing protein [Schaalia vaccimaxillae]|uniref:DUF3107 domain-containing protein n=1 Tax=Schaalia vaccimaxillae TaxID=183916 RepID=UPI0003B59A3E|nr:DUF3107 domain-containing protein [Schaalia vaccimaxillae]